MVTSSKSTFEPYRIDTPLTEIIAAAPAGPRPRAANDSSVAGPCPTRSSAPPAYLADEAALDAFVAAWRAGTLPKPEWTHAAHVAVCAWHAWDGPPVETVFAAMKRGIVAYNEAVGTANTATSGYHETLTRFWAGVVVDASARRGAADPSRCGPLGGCRLRRGASVCTTRTTRSTSSPTGMRGRSGCRRTASRSAGHRAFGAARGALDEA